MKTLIFGAGNLLLSDEGFGVHCLRYLQEHFIFPDSVELYDGGTLGIMVTHKFEEAEQVYILDTVDAEGAPGDIFRFDRDDIMLSRLPVKLSPHQIGIQEMLLISEMRGFCPERLTLLGVIPDSLDAGHELSSTLRNSLELVACRLVEELRASGVVVRERALAA
ncbi:MAG TPA: HyaD/HybD family hydrogenase maturation endopeptidase [Geomobilimonas sp.]|nr:HyaD/HybD family hydrogenase maturation endopeptidase [Geomobilimonas sp.]